MNVFILVGGYGTRLREVVNNVPKPMAIIEGKPFLEYQMSQIEKTVKNANIYLLSHYKAEVIINYFSQRNNVHVVVENEPLGTGGCIKNAIDILNLDKSEELLILNGDTYLEADFKKFISKSSKDINIIASFQDNCSRYGTLEIIDNKIVSFNEKADIKKEYINAGCYYFKNISFFKNRKLNKFAIEDMFIEYLNLNHYIGCFKYNGVFIDIGIPEDYYKMQEYIKVENFGK